jgi:hypothetical protein
VEIDLSETIHVSVTKRTTPEGVDAFDWSVSHLGRKCGGTAPSLAEAKSDAFNSMTSVAPPERVSALEEALGRNVGGEQTKLPRPFRPESFAVTFGGTAIAALLCLYGAIDFRHVACIAVILAALDILVRHQQNS